MATPCLFYKVKQMQRLILLTLLFTLIWLIGCKPHPYPKKPNYAIEKPKVKYKPSKKSLNKMVKKLQGSPYVWAEEGPNKFDCSGFTYYMYGSMGIEIPRVAREQAKVGQRIEIENLQYGDLIFFATNRSNRKKITHVGMYLGEGWFTHASTIKHEVIYSNLFTSKYYKERLRVCRRYLVDNDNRPWEKPEILKNQTRQASAKAVIVPTQALGEQNTPSNPVAQSVEGVFYIQVGSFNHKPNDTLLYSISRNGFKYKTIHFPQNGKMVYKLFIGPFKNRAKTKEILPEVRRKIQPDAFITEIR